MRIRRLNFMVAMLWIPILTSFIIERDLFWIALGIIFLAANSFWAFDNEPVRKTGGRSK